MSAGRDREVSSRFALRCECPALHAPGDDHRQQATADGQEGDGFHALFFEGDTWVFRTSDTLIRLFPEQFWFDAALTVAVLTVSGSLLAMLVAWRMERRMSKAQSTTGRDLAIPSR